MHNSIHGSWKNSAFHGRRLCRQSTNRHSGRRLSEAGLWASPSNSRRTQPSVNGRESRRVHAGVRQKATMPVKKDVPGARRGNARRFSPSLTKCIGSQFGATGHSAHEAPPVCQAYISLITKKILYARCQENGAPPHLNAPNMIEIAILMVPSTSLFRIKSLEHQPQSEQCQDHH